LGIEPLDGGRAGSHPLVNRRSWLAGWLPMGLAVGAMPGRAESGEPRAPRREVSLAGLVRFLPDVLRQRQLEVDTDPVARQIVLEQTDGSVTPLLSNGASRALWLDERLRGRQAEIGGWLHAGLPYLEVTNIRVEEQGQLRMPGYYCDVCTITVRYPQPCPCCQGPLELRYNPAP
jgi:hypothetical protein